jgi:[ribosomal protein S5]-alanine N-acetyltransferase
MQRAERLAFQANPSRCESGHGRHFTRGGTSRKHHFEPEALIAKPPPFKWLRRVQFPTGSPISRNLHSEHPSFIAIMQLPLTKSVIRSFVPSDAVAGAREIAAENVARNLARLPHPYTLKDAEEWIAKATAQSPETHFAISIDGQLAGGIGLERGDGDRIAICDHCAEIGYWLGESYWGRGIMSEAVSALTEWAFAELRLVRIYAAVFARNPASVRVLMKAGFEYEGRLRARYYRDGEYIDGLLYAKVRFPA